MNPSPGHREHPEHRVAESPIDGHMTVEIGGHVIADSRDVVRVEEDGHPPRYYFPREDTAMEHLKPSATRTTCPFKGQASYFDIRTDTDKASDAVWSYEQPYDEHIGLRGRVAFDETAADGLLIRSVA